MNLQKFDAAYDYEKETAEFALDAEKPEYFDFLKKSDELAEFLRSYGGRSYDAGLYRTHTYDSAIHWTAALEGYYPEFKQKILCFGYDWEGNMMAHRIDGESSVIMIFEIATGDYFELEQTICGFHEEDLIDYAEETIHVEKFRKAMVALGIEKLPWKACISHKVSLLLGGEDVVGNMELTDLDVHWSLQQQIMDEINKRA